MDVPAASIATKESMADRVEYGPVTTAEAGAGAAIAALVDEYAGTLYRVAYSVLRNAADAEDAVQETYLRVLRHREELGEIRDHRVWLVRIVWNVVLDRKRRAKTRPETDDIADLARMLPADGLSAEERVASAQHHERVLRAVEELPEKERQVLALSAFEDLSSVEIAQILGTTESTVRSRLFRARNLMAGLLGHARSVR
jgi:RNA polymerase sigma-70 factor, ECF subfamily